MIQEIQTIEDVKEFFQCLLAEDLNFHPDTDFNDYINGQTRLSTYSPEEAALRNDLLIQTFIVGDQSNIDIYELCCEIFN